MPVTVDDLVPLCRAVTSAAKRAMVVADLPFGSYQASPQQALATATRFMKEGLAPRGQARGRRADGARRSSCWSRAGIPVMGHIGFTPQSEHVLGGYRVQGRGDGRRQADGRTPSRSRPPAASPSSWRWCPAPVAARVTEALRIPTIGIGAGPHCDAQVLVWQDMAGLRGGRAPRFVKKYADLRADLKDAAQRVCRRGRLGRVPGRRALLRGLKPPRPQGDVEPACGPWTPRTHRHRPAGRPCRAAPRRRARTAAASSTSRPRARTCTARRGSSPGWCPRPRGCSTPAAASGGWRAS